MLSIAIDGPAGAGKSTVARRAAQELGYVYVDTGAMYRAIGYTLKKQGVDLSDTEAVAVAVTGVNVTLRFQEDGQHVYCGEEDVTGFIRTPEISLAASQVSAVPAVRAHLLALQQQMAKTNSVIMDGRDIGTVVLPDAQVKVFLTASSAVRARRRCLELEQKGTPQPYEDVLRDVEERDYQDSHRAVAPMKPAPDAVLLELASPPGGFDAEQARSLNLPVLAAPGLPGVYAPYTAAELMRETIYTVISEGDE